MKKYRSQKQQAPNVQPATSINFIREYHFEFKRLFLNESNDWDELLELNDFDVEKMPENQVVDSKNRIDYIPIFER
ncbi:hypothetical protein H5410_014397 [Solanum commersonii]|uniref:Uncharacterized protein n=1 Tax=Solanum commersonii TaxID=4109 RepID=A0A9J5ZQT3_SOLCO|nr:hypothetical protein H5410_014397 [Solanum commersonii]